MAADLVKQAIAGDRQALGALLAQEADYLARTAHLYLSRDADVQEAIGDTAVMCLKSIHTLREPAYFRTWLTKLLIRQCYRRYSKIGYDLITLDELPEPPAAGASVDAAVKLDLLAGLRALNDQYRQVLLMYYYNGLSIKEIAAVVDCSENTVKSQLRRGKAQLREWLGGDYFDD